MPAGTEAEVTLFTPHVRVPDLVIVGSHCTGLDLRARRRWRAPGLSVRSIAVGSLGGLAAAKRGECDLAPIHLFDEKTESYNTPFLGDGLELVPGWRRMQGIVFRAATTALRGPDARGRGARALADPACIMVNRNQGAGTRILIDRLLGGARPDGYWNQPKSHNAVAAAVAQHRADWGMTIAPVAHAAGLGFIPLAEEHYDFALVTARKQRPAVQAFCRRWRRTRAAPRWSGGWPAMFRIARPARSKPASTRERHRRSSLLEPREVRPGHGHSVAVTTPAAMIAMLASTSLRADRKAALVRLPLMMRGSAPASRRRPC